MIVEANPPVIDTPEESRAGTWAYAGDQLSRRRDHEARLLYDKHAGDLTEQPLLHKGGLRAIGLRSINMVGCRGQEWVGSNSSSG